MGTDLREGAIAMIDALGIKGIWRGRDGNDDTRAVATLRTAVQTAQGMKRYVEDALIPNVFHGMFGARPVVSVLSLSDTIIIAALPPEGKHADARLCWGLVDLVSQCATYVMRMAAQRDPPLTYRGAVNFGRFLIEDTFLLGPAVDEVADAHERANGAFVWLMPAADQLTPSPYFPDVWRTMAFRYAVPMKNAEPVTTTALSPFVDNLDPANRKQIREGYERAMKSDREDVKVKCENTLRFFAHLDEVQLDALQRAAQGRGSRGGKWDGTSRP
jgi:hypothetical protein